MKIRALGPLSGAVGERKKNEEFDVTKDVGEGLIARGYAKEVLDKKPAKAELGKE